MTITIETPAPLPARSRKASMWRGAALRCPACGQGALFTSYLKTAPACGHCGEALHHERAHDAPPYFTMTIVAHIIVPALLVVERLWSPPMWLHGVIWLPLTLVLTLLLLPMVKGAIIGLQWANRMHGFSGRPDDDE